MELDLANLHPHTALHHAFPGIYSGRVVDNDDPNKVGRVSVAVPAVYGDASSIAPWARPCFPFGFFYTPEVGDNVWVLFEGGDPNYPVWMGVWYADGKAPQEASKTSRVIRSASGHMIVLDDTANAEKVTIKDKNGYSIVISSDGIAITASGKNIVIKASKVDVQQG